MNGSLKNHSTRRVGVKRALSDSESTMYLNRFESKGRTGRRLVDDNTLYRLVKEGLENLVRTRRTVSVSELRTYVLGVDSGAFVALLNTVKITARSDCGRWKTRRFRGPETSALPSSVIVGRGSSGPTKRTFAKFAELTRAYLNHIII
jgi:hypothetical protein